MVGILGISLPIVLVAGSFIFGGQSEIQSSISEYYFTNMRDFYIGILCAIAFFMFSYRGYGKDDTAAGVLASIFALGVAFFPTTCPDSKLSTQLAHAVSPMVNNLHLISAICLFLVLAYFSFFLFTKMDVSPTKQKLIRNKVYRICGIIMLACIVLLVLYFQLADRTITQIEPYLPVFWIETLALFAFGTSWLIKGSAILHDRDEKKKRRFFFRQPTQKQHQGAIHTNRVQPNIPKRKRSRVKR
ncbi:MAG: DUF998 domain-containing protein [Bacteroidetes bacterium]|nr:DUF998 domain-containing protein [Bacteroidota bacterium]MBU1720936.1 DUF998 domain-containing protein [Bacteroidota bacterium]